MPKTVVLGPDSAVAGLLARARHAPATLLFLACCVAVFVVAEQHGSTEEVETLIRFGATERAHVWAGQAWRVVTAAFLHVGVLHLVVNVVTMLGWCIPVERALGTARFAVLYLGAAVAASAASLLAHDVVAAGASGAAFGVIGASLTLDLRRLGSWRLFAADRHVRSIGVAVVVWTVVLAGMSVDHAAHLGGLVGGIALTWSLTVPAGASPWPRRSAMAVAVAVVVLPAAIAVVPRAGVSRHVSITLSAVDEAIGRGELDQADRLLATLDAVRRGSPWIDYSRARVLEERGDLEAAVRGYEALARSEDRQARWLGARAAKMVLARRLANGIGVAPDEERARALYVEICALDAAAIAWGENLDVSPLCKWLAENPPSVAAKTAAPDVPR